MILAAANCPPLRDTVQSLANQVPRTLAWHTFADDPGIVARSADDHDRIIEALKPGPRKRARRLLQAHVLDTGETLARWLERHVPLNEDAQPSTRARRRIGVPAGHRAELDDVPVCGAWMNVPPPT